MNSLASLAPVALQSGAWTGRAFIRGGLAILYLTKADTLCGTKSQAEQRFVSDEHVAQKRQS